MKGNTWYTVKVRYTKQLENGALKRVTEPYLLAGASFTDAEAKIYEELGSIVRGEFSVTNITPIELADIFNWGDCGEWFRAKVQYESIDADSEKAKKVTLLFLVEAEDLKTADKRLGESLKGMLHGWRVIELKESKIVDIFTLEESK